MPPRESIRVANGLRHHVLEWGDDAADGPAVVLCHGFLDLAWGFVELAERLAAAGHRVFAFDWRGHGETEWVGAGGYYHFPDYLMDLHGLLPQLTGNPCHLVGHSMGGSVCTLFAATHPRALRSLSLIEGLGPPAPPPPPFHAQLTSWLSAVDAVRSRPLKPMADLDDALSRLRRRTPDLPDALGTLLAEKATRPAADDAGGEGRVWRWDPLHRTPSAYGFDVARFRECIAAIETPTLCVRGSRGMRTGDDAERYGLLCDARLVEIEGAGHMLQWTHADAVSEALQAFFAAH